MGIFKKKSPWASFSIPIYFFSLQIFLQGIFRKKEPAGIFRRKASFSIPKYFFSTQIFLQGIFSKKEPVGIFFYCKKTQKALKDAGLIKNMT